MSTGMFFVIYSTAGMAPLVAMASARSIIEIVAMELRREGRTLAELGELALTDPPLNDYEALAVSLVKLNQGGRAYATFPVILAGALAFIEAAEGIALGFEARALVSHSGINCTNKI